MIDRPARDSVANARIGHLRRDPFELRVLRHGGRGERRQCRHPALLRVWDNRERGCQAMGYCIRTDGVTEGGIEEKCPLDPGLPTSVQP